MVEVGLIILKHLHKAHIQVLLCFCLNLLLLLRMYCTIHTAPLGGNLHQEI